MKPLLAHEIVGNWATLLLPIKEDESINWKCLEAEIDALIEYKVDGIYSNGTAGEFYNVSEDEFDKVSAILAEKCNAADMPFQIGVSHMSPVLSLNRLKRTVVHQPSAVQVILPDWFKVTDEEALVFLEKMAAVAGEIGLVLYNPPHAKRNLTPEDFSTFQQKIPNLVGIKVAGGDEKWYTDMKKLCPDLSVFIPGHNLASGCLKGAQGAYSNMACLNPKAAQDWYDSIADDPAGALELEGRINRFLSTHILPLIKNVHFSNQAADKCMAAIGGWANIGTRLRWPYKCVAQDVALAIRPAAKQILPEFFL